MNQMILRYSFLLGWSSARNWAAQIMLNELYNNQRRNHFCYFAFDAEQEMVLDLTTAYAFMCKYK